jgi:hypothetical protein
VRILYNKWLVYDITLDFEKEISLVAFLTTMFLVFFKSKNSHLTIGYVFKLTKNQTGNWLAGTLIRKIAQLELYKYKILKS